MSFKRKYNKNTWIYSAIGFGAILYLLTMFVEPIFTKEIITTKKMLIGIPSCGLAGLIYGYWMKKYMERREKDGNNT